MDFGNSNIKKKFPLVYEAALRNSNQQKGKFNYRGIAFYTDETPEGDQFWNAIQKEDFQLAKTICPHLFK